MAATPHSGFIADRVHLRYFLTVGMFGKCHQSKPESSWLLLVPWSPLSFVDIVELDFSLCTLWNPTKTLLLQGGRVSGERQGEVWPADGGEKELWPAVEKGEGEVWLVCGEGEGGGTCTCRHRNKDFKVCGQMAVHNQFCMDVPNYLLTLYYCVQQFSLTLLVVRHATCTVYTGKAVVCGLI